MVAGRIAGKYAQVNYDTVPSVIYTHPEVAWVGQTEEQLKQEGKVTILVFSHLRHQDERWPREETAGMVKMIADKETDRIWVFILSVDRRRHEPSCYRHGVRFVCGGYCDDHVRSPNGV